MDPIKITIYLSMSDMLCMCDYPSMNATETHINELKGRINDYLGNATITVALLDWDSSPRIKEKVKGSLTKPQMVHIQYLLRLSLHSARYAHKMQKMYTYKELLAELSLTSQNVTTLSVGLPDPLVMGVAYDSTDGADIARHNQIQERILSIIAAYMNDALDIQINTFLQTERNQPMMTMHVGKNSHIMSKRLERLMTELVTDAFRVGVKRMQIFDNRMES